MTKDALLAARSQQDPLQVHRKRIIYSAAIAAVICLLPFSISEFVRGRVTLGLAILIVTLILAIVRIIIVHAGIDDLQSRRLNQAIPDPHTVAYNLRYMQESLEDAIERTRRTALPATTLMMDVDHFKRIKESFGREAGDT